MGILCNVWLEICYRLDNAHVAKQRQEEQLQKAKILNFLPYCVGVHIVLSYRCLERSYCHL